MNFMNLMKNAGKIKEMLHKQQEELAQKKYTGEAGGGWVDIICNGHGDILKINIADEAFQAGKEVVEELVTAAMNDCNNKVKRETQSQMQSLESLFGGGSMEDIFGSDPDGKTG